MIYGEVFCAFSEDGEEAMELAEPGYTTHYPDIDTLDFTVYFKTDTQTIYVTWDHTFYPYGLAAKSLELNQWTGDREQRWDVSDDQKWQEIVGQKVIDFKIRWEELGMRMIGTKWSDYIIYPQVFEICTENGKRIIITASELDRNGGQQIWPLMDNLLVTTNVELAKQLNII